MDNNKLKQKMDSINKLKLEYESKIKLNQLELLEMASTFDSYYDFYMFAKNACLTQEEFNITMFIGRPILLNKLKAGVA